MNLLGAKLYDPAVAVSKSTASLLAMTAFDTTNLRVAVTVPAHGMVYVRIMGGAVTGATTVPTLFLGVMNGSTVLARITPQDFPGTMNAATQSCPLYAECVITGLTPGAMNLDLAYGVEVVVASTNIKYGGPNDTTTNNAWGGISFQVWDPQPMTANSTLAVDTSGRVDIGKALGQAVTLDANNALNVSTKYVGGTVQTAGDLKASLNTLQADTDDIQTRLPAALVGGRMDSSTGAMAANVITAAAINASALNGKGDWNIGKTGYSLVAGYDAAKTASQAGDAMTLTAAYDAAKTALAASAYTAPDNTGVAAIKAKTDGLNFTVAGKLDVNVLTVNGITLQGAGTSGDKWRPA